MLQNMRDIRNDSKSGGKAIIYLFGIVSDRNDSVFFRHLIYYKYANNIRNDRHVSDTSRTSENFNRNEITKIIVDLNRSVICSDLDKIYNDLKKRADSRWNSSVGNSRSES